MEISAKIAGMLVRRFSLIEKPFLRVANRQDRLQDGYGKVKPSRTHPPPPSRGLRMHR